ncbi:Fur family transcriptional regulator [Ruania alba]|uniref:Fur family transcriptional regulator, ferric uptake regulator n=1 Tax=Ruania alba TaxID=648782 RepID=A0A1H5LGL3_9MICO|nr:Fur family transcriptional regulator [Ruania alba]SEE76170.1 Fur family transcriptional regulator, ferric uptake regulator [Ruania alba]
MDVEPKSSQTWSAALRSMGRRVTRQRLAVLEAAHRHPHASAETILDAARAELPALTAPSVYQVLTDLSEWGLLRKLETPDSPARYETRIGDNHHHVMCVRCGAVEDVSCVVGHAPCLTPAETGGMRIVAADVLFRGLCAACEATPDGETA